MLKRIALLFLTICGFIFLMGFLFEIEGLNIEARTVIVALLFSTAISFIYRIFSGTWWLGGTAELLSWINFFTGRNFQHKSVHKDTTKAGGR